MCRFKSAETIPLDPLVEWLFSFEREMRLPHFFLDEEIDPSLFMLFSLPHVCYIFDIGHGEPELNLISLFYFRVTVTSQYCVAKRAKLAGDRKKLLAPGGAIKPWSSAA